MRTVHYENCEAATSDTCRCAWCAGTRHGWQGALGIAKDANPKRYDDLQKAAEDKWKAELKERLKTSTNLAVRPLKHAATRLLKADIIGRLRRSARKPKGSKPQPDSATDGEPTRRSKTEGDHDPGTAYPAEQQDNILDQIDSLAKVMFNGVGPSDNKPSVTTGIIAKIENELGRRIPDKTRRAMADHFWCDILAHLAHTLDQAVTVVDKIPDHVADVIIKARTNERRPPVEDVIVKLAVKYVWTYLQKLTLFGLTAKGKAVVVTLRVLAILMCKQPDRHKAVIQYCVDPMGQYLKDETKERLKTTLQDWLPSFPAVQ
ncbi:hypothetical protein [Amycolatopsis magusensis]|uniref:hypothetical protein n=1 Tax=Amycolatopsis magusensis TaxID=882444 RepID=UPI00379811D8